MQTQKKKIRTQKSKEDNDFMNLTVDRKIQKKRKNLKIRVQKWKEVQKGFGKK
jgi:hypothetical protein